MPTRDDEWRRRSPEKLILVPARKHLSQCCEHLLIIMIAEMKLLFLLLDDGGVRDPRMGTIKMKMCDHKRDI
jgi:hypothetical protein